MTTNEEFVSWSGVTVREDFASCSGMIANEEFASWSRMTGHRDFVVCSGILVACPGIRGGFLCHFGRFSLSSRAKTRDPVEFSEREYVLRELHRMFRNTDNTVKTR